MERLSTNVPRPVTLADTLSIVPVLQQVIGLATIVSNSFKCIGDCFQALSHSREASKQISLIEKEIRRINDGFKEKTIDITEATLNNQVETLKEIKSTIVPKKTQFDHHLEFIKNGIKRMIPIIGTIYSLKVRQERKDYEEKLEAQKLSFTEPKHVVLKKNFDGLNTSHTPPSA